MKKVLCVVTLALSVIAFCGCSVSQRSIDDAQKRINSLKAKGVPDSSLSDAIKYLYGATYAKEKDDNSLARHSLDSASTLIAQAESNYSENLVKMKPYIDSLIGVIQKAKADFTGMQAKKVDSAMLVINGFTEKNWIYQVEDNAKKAVAMLPQLKFNEDRAKELKPRLYGEWVCLNTTKSDADKTINAVEKKIFSFFKDGKVKLDENKKGQSAKNLKEDWEFLSYGTFDLLGDTVYMFIDRFACARQNFEKMVEKDKKKSWERETHPAYDSAITDHSQDRWIPYMEMEQDFKQQKKF